MQDYFSGPQGYVNYLNSVGPREFAIGSINGIPHYCHGDRTYSKPQERPRYSGFRKFMGSLMSFF